MTDIRAADFATAYRESLRLLLDEPVHTVSPRGMTTHELPTLVMTVSDPRMCLYHNAVRSSRRKYIAAEFMWYFAGRDDLEYISRHAKFWEQVANPDGTLNSAYGKLIFRDAAPSGTTQWGWCYNALTGDPDTRQAILHFNRPDHQRAGNKDFVCTLHGYFSIRDGALDLTICMRSNDAVLGTPTDVPFFCVLQQQMLRHVSREVPGLTLGSYTHIVHSYHLYERDFDRVRQMLADPGGFVPEGIGTLSRDIVGADGAPTPEFLSAFQADPPSFAGFGLTV